MKILDHIYGILSIIFVTWGLILIALYVIDKIVDITRMSISNSIVANVVNLIIATIIGGVFLRIIFIMVERYLYYNLERQ
ncbi:MAG: hypothetical protein ACP6IS_05930 [Candidatus Asgardarchaeia archaeon]